MATPIAHIRKQIFKVPQADFAVIAGTTQTSVSRWEKGEQVPDINEMERIRSAARERGIEWEDRWFFEASESIAS